jgi:protein-tyrosine-phosphatase
MNILFMCVANSARSQLAEGIARRLFGSQARIESAGSLPAGVSSFAVRALKEVGIDAAGHRSKGFHDLPADFTADLDFVITLCAEEVCPVVVSKAKRLHWPLPDPAGRGGTDEERLEGFRKTREAITARLTEFAKTAGLEVAPLG